MVTLIKATGEELGVNEKGRLKIFFCFIIRPVSIPSSSGADFPNIPKFGPDISFGFGDNFPAVNNAPNSAAENFKRFNRFRPVNYQEDPSFKRYHFQNALTGDDDEDDVHGYDDDHGNDDVTDEEHFDDDDHLVPERFGPQPIDFEQEKPFTVPVAPPSFNSIETADFELSPQGQGQSMF